MPEGHRHEAVRRGGQRVRRVAQVCGVLGGLAWVAAWALWTDGDEPVQLGLFWGGAAFITFFLLELGTLLVKRGLLALRLFVACALPLLFWMVIAFAADASDDDGIVWGVAGVATTVFAFVLLVRPTPPTATL